MTNEHLVGLLPLQKFWEISRQIHEFMTWTQVECPFEKDKKIQSYLLTAPIYSEEGEGHDPHLHTRLLPRLGPELQSGSSACRVESLREGRGQTTDKDKQRSALEAT